jgi:hypothetical protein
MNLNKGRVKVAVLRPLIGILMALTAGTVPQADAEADFADQFEWLLGTWIQKGEKRTFVEEWSLLSKNIFQGQGFVSDTQGEQRNLTETILLVRMNGDVFYIAKARQNELPVSFKMTSSSEKEVIFENPDHDFPKRIHYALKPDGTLQAVVSDGADRGFTLVFQPQPMAKKTVE